MFTQKASPAAIIATPVIKINNESILYLFKILLPTYTKPTVAIRHPANNHIVFSVIADSSFVKYGKNVPNRPVPNEVLLKS